MHGPNLVVVVVVVYIYIYKSLCVDYTMYNEECRTTFCLI